MTLILLGASFWIGVYAQKKNTAIAEIKSAGKLWGLAYIDYAVKHNLNPEIPIKACLIGIVFIIIVTATFTFLFWLFYRLLYGILLKKLSRNYEELKKIDL